MDEVAIPRRHLCAIEAVARHRMMQRSHVRADLVRASGADANFQKREAVTGFDRFPVRERGAAG